MQRKGWAMPKNDENHPNWKGEDAGYSAKHNWIRKVLGKPSKCDRCQTITAKRYEWANKSKQYKRDVADWERLCTSCHRKDGYKNGEYVSPNKGKKMSKKLRKKLSESHKGQVPWNKGLKRTFVEIIQ